jgi:hypothetical protein
LKNEDTLENFDLFDGKEIYVQIIDNQRYFEYMPSVS